MAVSGIVHDEALLAGQTLEEIHPLPPLDSASTGGVSRRSIHGTCATISGSLLESQWCGTVRNFSGQRVTAYSFRFSIATHIKVN